MYGPDDADDGGAPDAEAEAPSGDDESGSDEISDSGFDNEDEVR